MTSRTPKDNLAVASTQSTATDSTALSPFQHSEAATGVRLHEPSPQLDAEPSTDSPPPSKWQLHTEPDVMLSMLRALIGGS